MVLNSAYEDKKAQIYEILQKKMTSLLGYMARNNRTEWNHLIDFIKEKIKDFKLEANLRNIGEYTDIPGLILNSNLTDENKKFIIDSIMAWLNELRPSDKSGAESMEQDWIEYHLFVSHQLGDYKYYKAVRKIATSGEYLSLNQAHKELSKRSRRGEELSKEEKDFLEGYNNCLLYTSPSPRD